MSNTVEICLLREHTVPRTSLVTKSSLGQLSLNLVKLSPKSLLFWYARELAWCIVKWWISISLGIILGRLYEKNAKLRRSCNIYLTYLGDYHIYSLCPKHIFYTFHAMYCSLFIVLYTMNSMLCIIRIILYILYPCPILYSIYSLHCILCIVFYVLYSLHCILFIVLYALNHMHYILSLVLHTFDMVTHPSLMQVEIFCSQVQTSHTKPNINP